MICPEPVDLTRYHLILINTSGGKDSIVSAFYVAELAKAAGVLDRCLLVHATFKEEWPGTVDVVRAQAERLGIKLQVVSRKKDGQDDTLLDYVRRRKKWPSSMQRYCTSDFKRAPIDKVITAAAPGRGYHQTRVLNVMGIRAGESRARAKRVPFRTDPRRTNSRRVVHEWLPIFRLSTEDVWAVIRQHTLPMHDAYGLGIPRLSCRLCIFAPRSVLITAGRANLELLREYAQVEQEIGHQFRQDLSITSVLEAVEAGEAPGTMASWSM